MNNVFTFDPQAKEAEQRKQELLEVIDEIRSLIESGEIKELVACSMDRDGTAQIHASCLDLPGGVGLFEIGKVMMINRQTLEF
jgi:hypothetical protein